MITLINDTLIRLVEKHRAIWISWSFNNHMASEAEIIRKLQQTQPT